MIQKKKVAVVVSHPIQHFCPQYESWSKLEGCVIKVFFGSALGYKSYFDPNFKQEISWDLNLNSFDHHFLNGDQVISADKKLDAPSLNQQLDEYKPDLIILYGYFQPLQRRAYNYAQNTKVKVAYISDAELRHKLIFWKRWLKYFLLSKYFRRIDYFLTVGNANEEYYQYYGVPVFKFKRMYFPIDILQYEDAYLHRKALREATRAKFEISKQDFVMSVVGKLVPWKNQDHIIDAMQILERKFNIVTHLFVIGSGEMLEPWKTKSMILRKSKVHFTGFVGIKELPSYYAASNIYVHSASLEPHSIAISEAIFMGCPIIISDNCEIYKSD